MQAGLFEPVHRIVERLHIRDWPVVTNERQIDVGTQCMECIDAVTSFRSRPKCACAAARIAQRDHCTFGSRSERLAASTASSSRPRKSKASAFRTRNCPKYRILRAEPHRHLDLMQGSVRMSASTKRHR